MEALRWIGSVLALLGWGTVTALNARLVVDRLRRRPSGSFVPFTALLLGEAAIFLCPWPGLPDRALLAVLPVVLDVGIWLWAGWLISAAAARLRSPR